MTDGELLVHFRAAVGAPVAPIARGIERVAFRAKARAVAACSLGIAMGIGVVAAFLVANAGPAPMAPAAPIAAPAAAPIQANLNARAFRDQVYACWLGKTIGGTLGGPGEGAPGPLARWYYVQVMKDGRLQASNDEVDMQLVFHGAGEGTLAASFLAAIESAAFVEKDRDRLVFRRRELRQEPLHRRQLRRRHRHARRFPGRDPGDPGGGPGNPRTMEQAD
jgi:hypothetical protein